MQCPLDHSCQMVNKCTTESFKSIDPLTKKRQHFLVLHYNGEISQKWDLVATSDRGVLLTQGQSAWTAFCKIFSETPHLTIFGAPKYVPKYAKYGQICQICIFGCIFGRAIWSSGVSLKRSCKMQFRRVGLRSIGPSSQKLWPNQIFGRNHWGKWHSKIRTFGFFGTP